MWILDGRPEEAELETAPLGLAVMDEPDVGRRRDPLVTDPERYGVHDSSAVPAR
jgi:hypothetical protein